jgi:predicted metalloprotease with PDZ domain
MAEADLRAVLASLAGQPLDTELDAWVHSTAELPVTELLKAQGVTVDTEPAPLTQRLGLRVTEANGITLKNVLRGGPAEQAGLASGDEWLAVECAPGEIWRITKLDDIAPLLGARPHLHALVSRDRRVLRLPLAWPQAGDAAPGQTVVKLTHGSAPTATPSAWPARLG